MPAPEFIHQLVAQFEENLQIEPLVYQLYGLTAEEIQIVEGST